jgi:hypothetical protein
MDNEQVQRGISMQTQNSMAAKEENGTAEQEFIGEGYVHGLMEGQVLEWLEDGEVSEECFRLV